MVDKIPVGDNGDECNLAGGRWRKSSYSMSNGHCVETARLAGDRVGVRDSQAAVAGGGPRVALRTSSLGRLPDGSPESGKCQQLSYRAERR
jgi:hypothetical protein